MKLIMESWRMYTDQLAEKTRADKEGVQLPSVADELATYVEIDSNGMPISYITFTEINKLGINPRSEYHTPNGIYTYPLTKDILKQLKAGRLPFAQNQPYISLIQPHDRDAMATNDMGVDELQAACIKLYSRSGAGPLVDDLNRSPSIANDYRSMMHNTGGRDASWEQISNSESYIYAQKAAAYKEPFGILWSLTRMAAGRNPNRWSAIWRALGYDGALDMGRGIIHNNEKTQAVFFAKNVVDHIKTFVNKETPKKIDRRASVMYRAAAGKITSAAFDRGPVLASFSKYQSWSLFSDWLKEKIRAQIIEDLTLLYTIYAIEPGQSHYPWLAIAKGDYNPREKAGFEGLTREIADPSSNAHKNFWAHKKTTKNVFSTLMGPYRDLLRGFLYDAKAGQDTPGERSRSEDVDRIRAILEYTASLSGNYKDIDRLLNFADEMILKFPARGETWAKQQARRARDY